MEVIRILLSLCSSAAAVFAIALAYDSHEKVEQLEKLINGRSEVGRAKARMDQQALADAAGISKR